MRIHLPIIAIALLGGAVVAQATHQQFELHGSQTSFTSRGSLGVNTGELLQGFHASHFVGLAELDGNSANRRCEITQLTVQSQDQNCQSRETWDFVVRGGTDAAGPRGDTGGIIGEVKGLRTPNSGRTTCAFLQTVTLAPAARIKLTCPTVQGTSIKRDFFSVGIRLGVAPQWANDGQSIHTAFGTAAQPDQNSWSEQVLTGAETHAWQLIGTATVAVNATDFRTWRLGWSTHGVTMQLGCGFAWGMGGMFPRYSSSSRPISFDALIRGGPSMANAASVVVLSPTLFPAILPLGSGASIYVSAASPTLFFGRPASGRGEVIVPLAPFLPQLNPPAGAKVPFQAALDSPTLGLKLSNVQFCQPK